MRLLYTLLFSLLLTAAFAQQRQIPPGLILYTPDSVQVDSKDIVKPGHLTLLVMWNSMMRPAIAELDSIHTVYPAWHERYGVELVTVCWEYPHKFPENLRKFLGKRNWPYPVYVDQSKALVNALAVNSFPITLFLNKKGEVVHRTVGFDPKNIKTIEEKLAELSIE